MSVHKKVEANKMVPKAIGSEKNGNLTIFKTCIFPAITATTENKYIPACPKNFKKNKILKKLINKKINHVEIIDTELNILTKSSKLKINN